MIFLTKYHHWPDSCWFLAKRWCWCLLANPNLCFLGAGGTSSPTDIYSYGSSYLLPKSSGEEPSMNHTFESTFPGTRLLHHHMLWSVFFQRGAMEIFHQAPSGPIRRGVFRRCPRCRPDFLGIFPWKNRQLFNDFFHPPGLRTGPPARSMCVDVGAYHLKVPRDAREDWEGIQHDIKP